MTPSIWSTRDRDTLAVCTDVDAKRAIGHIRRHEHGWVIVDDPQQRSAFATIYDAANALAGIAERIEYKDYLLGKGEESRTVRTTSEQVKRIIDEGGWKMVSASAPRLDEVN